MAFTITDCSNPVTLNSNGSSTPYKFVLSSVSKLQRIEFSVRAAKHVYIALSSQPYQMDDMYEVVIGANNGKLSYIRRCSVCERTAALKLSSGTFINDAEFADFWISWGRGKISVGYGGEDEAFTSWTDENPLEIRYVGYQSRKDVESSVKFCGLGTLMTHISIYWKLFKVSRCYIVLVAQIKGTVYTHS